MKQSIIFAETLDFVELHESSKKRWTEIYLALETEKEDECLGPLIARAETHILRISGIIAISELSKYIYASHLNKAYEIWQSCSISADEIFCSCNADKYLKKLMSALENSKEGLTLSQIRNDVFGRNKSKQETSYYLEILEKRELAKMETIRTKGRPAIKWHAIKQIVEEEN